MLKHGPVGQFFKRMNTSAIKAAQAVDIHPVSLRNFMRGQDLYLSQLRRGILVEHLTETSGKKYTVQQLGRDRAAIVAALARGRNNNGHTNQEER